MTDPRGAFAAESHPKGWEPHVELEGNRGTAVSQPTADSLSHDELIAGWQLSPDDWEIVGDVNVRRWQRYDGDWLHYYKANLRRKVTGRLDLADALAIIKRHRKRPTEPKGDSALVVCPSDWQLGQGRDGGTAATVEYIYDMIDRVLDRQRDLKRIGYQVDRLLILNPNDGIENTCGFYPSQPFEIDMTLRDQMNLYRRILVDMHRKWAGAFGDVTSAAAHCNHGQSRNSNGRVATDDSDNLALQVYDSVADAFAMNDEAFGHLRFEIPRDEWATVHRPLPDGPAIGMIHGHQAEKATGGAPVLKVYNWWQRQAMSAEPDGDELHVGRDASILVSGHFHHFWHWSQSGRTTIGCPAAVGKRSSKYLTDSKGLWSDRGTVTFALTTDGVEALEIL